MARRKSKAPRRKIAKMRPKLKIRNYLTTMLITSAFVAYLGNVQYGYSILLVNQPLRTLKANLTTEELRNIKDAFLIMSPAAIFYPIGGLMGIVLFANLADKYGRKGVLLLANTIAFFASILLCLINTIQVFQFALFANFMTGISSGMFSCCVPLYLLEITPTPIRGAITVVSSFFLTLGGVLCHLLGVPQVLGKKEDYPFMAAVLGIFATICIVLLLVCPESPRFIFIQKKNETKAREALRRLRNRKDVGKEMKELQDEDSYEVMANEKKMTFKIFFCSQKFQWPIINSIVLMGGSQLSGINVMFFYLGKVYLAMALPTSISNIIALGIYLTTSSIVLLTAILIERCGRRIPLIMGYMICSMTCILLTFTLEFQDQSFVLAVLSLVFIIIFLIGRLLGPATICFVIMGEMFLQSTRASAFTIGYFTLWFVRFFTGLILIRLEALLGTFCLLVYWPFCLATFIYLFKMLPETMGKRFLDIQLTKKEW